MILSPPANAYVIEYGTGEPGDPWDAMSTPFRSLRAALAWFHHLTRSNPIDAYRVVDNEGRTVVAMVPGHGGAA